METERAELGMSASDRRFVFVVFPLAGAVLGVVLPYVWSLVDDVEWLPMRGPVSALLSLDEGWQWLARAAILAAAGLALAIAAVVEDTSVSVGPQDVVVSHNGSSRTIPRGEIAGVYRDGKRLVIETAYGRRLLDAPVDGAKKRGRAAFTRFGYPWESD